MHGMACKVQSFSKVMWIFFFEPFCKPVYLQERRAHPRVVKHFNSGRNKAMTCVEIGFGSDGVIAKDLHVPCASLPLPTGQWPNGSTLDCL